MNRWSKTLGSVGGVTSVAVALALSVTLVAPGAAWAGSHLKAQDKTATSGTVQKKLQTDKKAPSGPAASGAVLGGQSANKDCEKLKTADKKCANSTARTGAGTPGGVPAFDPRIQDRGGPQNQGGSFTKEHGGEAKVTPFTPGQSTGLVDPRGTGEKPKEKPKGNFDDLSKQGQLDKLRTGMEDKVKDRSENVGVIIGPDGKPTGEKLGDKTNPGQKFNESQEAIWSGAKGNKTSKQEQQSDAPAGDAGCIGVCGGGEKSLGQKVGEAAAKAYGAVSGAVRDLVGPETYDKKYEGHGGIAGGSGVRGTPIPDAVEQSPGEKEKAIRGAAEREAKEKRKVTLPDGEKGGKPDRTDLEKIYVAPGELEKRTRDRLTGGRIDPVDDGATSGTRSGTPVGQANPNNPTGRTSPFGTPYNPLAPHAPGGSDPDNPTMSTGSSSSSGTAGDSRSTR